MSIVVGLTGGIACGKSTAGDIFSENGFVVLDTDQVAHDCQVSDGPCYQAILDHFGTLILDDQGKIDRKKLGAVVFSDPEELKVLNRILHPEISRRWRSWRDQQRMEGTNACVLIPLLFEVGAVDGWDKIVVVSANESVVMERLKMRGLTMDQSKDRINAQMDVNEKAKRADIVIENNGSLAEFKWNVEQVIEQFDTGRKKI